MKRNLFLLTMVAILLNIGCKKTEVQTPDINSNQIAFRAKISQPTKAIYDGTTYSQETFGMYAYATLGGDWENNGDLSNPIMGTTAGSTPEEIKELINVWKASNGSYYWPEGGSSKISFFGYSPYKDAQGNIINTTFTKANGVIITSYDNNAQQAKLTDLMYSTPALDRTYTSSDVFMGELPVVFNHALTKINFTVKSLDTYSGVTININKITLKDIPSKGTFNSIVPTDVDNWSNLSEPIDYIIFDGGTAPQIATTTVEPIGDTHLMIPQNAKEYTFEIEYDIIDNGKKDTYTRTLVMGESWEMNKSIKYNIAINLSTIEFIAIVSDWDTAQEVNTHHFQCWGNSEVEIIEGLDNLNAHRTTISGAEDITHYTLAVAAGATGNINLYFNDNDNFAIGDIITLQFNKTANLAPVINNIPGWERTGSLTANNTGAITLVKKEEVKAMRFTIDTRKNTDNTSDATFVVPLNAEVLDGYNLTIYWGDGTSTDYSNGFSLTQSYLTKTYTNAGEYTISVASSQTDYTQKQIPNFNFFNYNANNSNIKLISFSTPLLNTAQLSFESIFDTCESLEYIPNNLFIYNTEVTDFNYAFYGCLELKLLPEDLFKTNVKAQNFIATFLGCSSLTRIPTNLFANCINAEDFYSVFNKCTSLLEIPNDLFAKNINAQNFNYSFNGCTQLTDIPEGLFANNINATSFKSTFDGCSKLQLNPNIFCNEATEKTVRFKDKNMDFGHCFMLNVNSYAGNQGTAPALWEYEMSTTSTKSGCFSGHSQSSLDNYDIIPAAWGGPGIAVKVGDIYWAVGNMVTDGNNKAKIGAPTDYGLYFTFGDLYGWSGGANGDGAGQGEPTLDNVLWPLGSSKKSAWEDTTYYGDENIDPCKHYLGGKWRLPTFAEQQSITGKTADTPWATSGLTAKREVYNGVNGAWFGPGLDGNTGTTNILTQVFLPLMGYRTNAGGAITSISEQVYYYSSNISSLTDAFCFGFSSTNARMGSGYARSTGRAVRCVWK